MHRREMAPGQLPIIHQKGSLASIFACTTMCDVRGLSQAPPKTQVSHRTQRSVAVIWETGIAWHRNRSTRLLRASHYDWRDAQKLTANVSLTQTDYQTSCKLFSVLFQWRCFGVFRRKRFFSASKSLGGHAKISISSLYLKIIICRLAVECR